MTADLEQQVREIVYAALNDHDMEKYLAFHAEDVIVYLPDGTAMRGRKELGAYLQTIFNAFPDAIFEMISCISSESLECDEWTMSGTQLGEYKGVPATGRKVMIRGATIRRMKDGKASPVAFYFDTKSILQQLGKQP